MVVREELEVVREELVEEMDDLWGGEGGRIKRFGNYLNLAGEKPTRKLDSITLRVFGTQRREHPAQWDDEDFGDGFGTSRRAGQNLTGSRLKKGAANLSGIVVKRRVLDRDARGLDGDASWLDGDARGLDGDARGLGMDAR